MEPSRDIIWAAVSTKSQADEEEKFSIPKQIEDGTNFATERHDKIVDILVVPGHSRDYRTLDELAEAARKKNIDAFDKLIRHFERKDFDLFICRDANRFARKASLLHYIAEMIVEECGAVIYDQSNNLFVDEEMLPMWATLQGYKTRAEVKWLVKARHDGMEKRAKRGLPTSSHGLIPSHKVIEIDKSKVVAVNEDNRRLFMDLAELLLANLSWLEISNELQNRGHVRLDGTRYPPETIRNWMMHPTLYGNTAQHFQDGHKFSTARGLWVFDPDEARPHYVEMFYGTHEPMHAGELAERIKDNMRYRRGANNKAHPVYKNKFTSLVVCDNCGYAMGYANNHGIT